MADGFSASVDSKAFDAAMKEYIKYSKRSTAEIVNTKAYFVATAAVGTTGAVDKEKIARELTAQSHTSRAPLAALLINARNGAKGLKGLTGAKMATAVNKLIRVRQRTANFLRAGWIPAIQALAPLVKFKKGSTKYKSVKKYCSSKGGATVSKGDFWKATAEIYNSVTSGKQKTGLDTKGNPQVVADKIEDGLNKAIAKETKSMLDYVKKKSEEALQKLKTR